MALNYAKSNTFVTGTTISSSAVNANFDDLVNIFAGLEALTKSFSNLLIDTTLRSTGTIQAADGTAALPAIVFTADATTGFWRNGTGDIAASTSGVRRLDISTTQIKALVPFLVDQGTVRLSMDGSGTTDTLGANYGQSVGITNASNTSAAINFTTPTTNASVTIQTSDTANVSPTTVATFQSAANGGSQLKGTTKADAATAGNVGEVIESIVANVSAGTSLQYFDVTSIVLTAGDWMLYAQASIIANGATVADNEGGIGTATGNNGAGLVNGDTNAQAPNATTAVLPFITIPGKHINISAGATYYLKGFTQYTVATPKWNGRITAVRIR